VYNPLEYAWQAHRTYLERYGNSRKRVLYLGMNPGPWGMAQTGIPFGEVAAVRDWLKIHERVDRPPAEHPKRPIQGMECTRSEVSGRRLWGLFSGRFPTPAKFFKDQFVANYCPLVFMDEGARNVTPDKIRASAATQMHAACDRHLLRVIQILDPEWLVGVGQFAENCLRRVLQHDSPSHSRKVIRILHPSPASPAANKNWASDVAETLENAGILQKIR
jgi:single-strand selective monofunctional uracil DNA glycosylase